MTLSGKSAVTRKPRLASDVFPVVFAAMLAAIAVALRLVDLGRKSLWLDEAASSMMARSDWHTFFTALIHRQANMGLYYFLLRGWIHLGDSDAMLRLPSVVFGGLAVVVMYQLARSVAGTRAAWIGAFLMTINLFHIQYSQEARGYALVTFLALLSCYFFAGVLEAPTKRKQAAYIAASLLMIYAHVFGVWILLAQFLFALVRYADRRKTVLLDVGIIGLMVLPLAVSLLFLSDRSQLSWMSPGSASSVYAVFLNFSGGDFSGNAFSGNAGLALLIVYAALLLFSLRSRWREGRREASTEAGTAGSYVFLWIWLLLPILSAGMISLYRPMLQARYLILCLPAFLLLAADGLARIGSKFIFIAALAAIGGASLVGMNSYYRSRTDQDHGDNWRDATAYCLSQTRSADAILFPYSAEEIPFRDYQVRLGTSTWSGGTVVPQKSELELLSEAGTWTDPELATGAAGRYRRLWVVTALRPSAASLQIQSALRMQLREESRRRFGFVTVQLFVPMRAEVQQ